jgi:UDP-glucose 4,6-dehydratase
MHRKLQCTYVTVTDLLPVSIDMTVKKIKGVFNFTNPGAVSHNEIMLMYKQVCAWRGKLPRYRAHQQPSVAVHRPIRIMG